MASSPIYTKRMQKALQLRGRRRHHDLQGPAARHRCPAAVHGLPLHRARPVARRVPPRPLRRADGRRADGRGLRPRHVPRHRGPDVRRHRAWPPTARRRSGRSTGRRGYAADRHPHCAWTVDHRRVLSRSRGPSRRWTSYAEPARRRTELDPIDPDDEGRPTTRAHCCRTSTSVRSPTRRLVRIADEVCLQMHLLNLSFVIAVRQARGRRNAELATKICTRAAHRHRRHRRRAHSSARSNFPAASRARCACSNCIRCSTRRHTCRAEFGPDYGARPSLARPRGRCLDLVGHPQQRTGRCRRSSQRSTRISTWRSTEPIPTGRRVSSKPTPRQRSSARSP